MDLNIIVHLALQFEYYLFVLIYLWKTIRRHSLLNNKNYILIYVKLEIMPLDCIISLI